MKHYFFPKNQALFFCLLTLLGSMFFPTPVIHADTRNLKKNIDHIVVIYQENWSFDGLYGKFPGANGFSGAAQDKVTQRNLSNTAYQTLVVPLDTDDHPDQSKNRNFPNSFFDLSAYIPADAHTRDLVHRFLHERAQIDGGRMDHFVLWSNAKGLAMSYYDATGMPEGLLARNYTLCDNFFHAAFGGSFLNHQWMVSAQTPIWEDPVNLPPREMVFGLPDYRRSNQGLLDEKKDTEYFMNASGKFYAVNTVYPARGPRPPRKNKQGQILPPLTSTTIGDELSQAGVSWKWYSGGWNIAVTDPAKAEKMGFQFHHQPFVYYAKYALGNPAQKKHLQDEENFRTDLKKNTLPAVCWIKPLGPDNEHPGYASLLQGQRHVAELVNLIMSSHYGEHTLIIITYDEHGGRWDHVTPPGMGKHGVDPGVADEWGPGTRVACILVSPYVKQSHVDHTLYDTTSILKLIEERFRLRPLSTRDKAVNSLSQAITDMPQKK